MDLQRRGTGAANERSQLLDPGGREPGRLDADELAGARPERERGYAGRGELRRGRQPGARAPRPLLRSRRRRDGGPARLLAPGEQPVPQRERAVTRRGRRRRWSARRPGERLLGPRREHLQGHGRRVWVFPGSVDQLPLRRRVDQLHRQEQQRESGPRGRVLRLRPRDLQPRADRLRRAGAEPPRGSQRSRPL